MSLPCITDRTPGDLAQRNKKGVYNSEDLNRVERVVWSLAASIRNLPGQLEKYAESKGVAWEDRFAAPWSADVLDLTTNTLWSRRDLPTASEMERYLSNVAAIQQVTAPVIPLSYIESTGAQCIDTGLLLTGESFRAEFDFQYTNVTGSKSHGIFGCGVSGASLDVYQNSSRKIAVIVGGKNVAMMNAISDRLFMVLEAGGTTCRCSITPEYNKGASISQVYTTIVNPHTVMVGSDHYNGRVDPCYMRIYSCKIWQGGELVRDFIPAKSLGGTVGAYDRATDRLFPNAGTGGFLAGEALEDPDCVTLPESMNRLTIYGANAIEASLLEAEARIEEIRARRMALIDQAAWVQSANKGMTAGEITAGEWR